jgi:tripartite-type tricarboxylate transporter receptor subunit TctC
MLLMDAIDVSMTTVPYKGTGPAMTDLLGGQVDMMCDQTTNTVNQIKAGKIKGYAVTTPERLPVLPDLPTLDESGLEGFEMTVWHGLFAPAGTPKEIIEKLSAALQAAVQDPKVTQRFADLGTVPVSPDQATPAALDQHLAAEIVKWKPIIESAGVFAD